MGMSKTTKTILAMVEKHGRELSYLGKCTGSEFKGGKYVLMHKVNGEPRIYLATDTQKEMIEKLSLVVDMEE